MLSHIGEETLNLDLLTHAVSAFQDLLGKEHHVLFSNGREITVFFQPANFIHLAGLRKLTDLPVMSVNNSAVYLHRYDNGYIRGQNIVSVRSVTVTIP